MYLHFLFLKSCLFACWKRSNRSFLIVEKSRNCTSWLAVKGAHASLVQALKWELNLCHTEMDFCTCEVSEREVLQMCVLTFYIFVKPESALRFPETFFRAAMILRCMPYKDYISIGQNNLFPELKLFSLTSLKKKKKKLIKDYLRRKAIVISYEGHLSSPFISAARLGAYSVFMSRAWIVFSFLLVLKMHLAVYCQCACSFWLQLTSSWAVH